MKEGIKMQNEYKIAFSSLDVFNAAYGAICTRIEEKREMYKRCKESIPYYPSECARIAKEIEELKQALVSFDNYKFERKEEEGK